MLTKTKMSPKTRRMRSHCGMHQNSETFHLAAHLAPATSPRMQVLMAALPPQKSAVAPVRRLIGGVLGSWLGQDSPLEQHVARGYLVLRSGGFPQVFQATGREWPELRQSPSSSSVCLAPTAQAVRVVQEHWKQLFLDQRKRLRIFPPQLQEHRRSHSSQGSARQLCRDEHRRLRSSLGSWRVVPRLASVSRLASLVWASGA